MNSTLRPYFLQAYNALCKDKSLLTEYKFENVPCKVIREQFVEQIKSMWIGEENPTADDFYQLWQMAKTIVLSADPNPTIYSIEKDYEILGIYLFIERLVKIEGEKYVKIPCAETMRALIDQNYIFGKISSKGAFIRVGCPKDIASACFKRSINLGMAREVTRIISTPTLRPDISVLDQPGFDPETGVYLMADGPRAPISSNASDSEIEGHWSYLKDLLCDFAFDTNLDEANAYAALFLACCRTALDEAPMIIVTSATRADGKSTFGRLLGILCTGVLGKGEIGEHKTEEEAEKKITQTLLNGSSFVQMDDFAGPIGGRFLAQLLTATGKMSLRRLGTSEGKEIDSRVLFVATGKNLSATEDCLSRSRIVRLNPGKERPEERVFVRKDVLDYTLKERHNIVAAILTIIKTYHATENKKDLTGIERGHCRYFQMHDIIDCVVTDRFGIDPSMSTKIAEEEDDDVFHLQRLLECLKKCFGRRGFYAKDLLAIIHGEGKSIGNPNDAGSQETHEEIRESLNYLIDEKLTSLKAVGFFLRRIKGRVVGDVKLSAGKKTVFGTIWMVV